MKDFDHYATEYDAHLDKGIGLSGENREFFARGRLEIVKKLFRLHAFHPRRAIDFGCGTGMNLGMMAAMWSGLELTGLDSSEHSLSIARQRVPAFADSFCTPENYRETPRAPVDWVFCNGVFHHIPPDVRPSALASIISLLRPGGALTLFDNNPFNPGTHLVMRRIPFDRDAKMINPYTLASDLRKIGFSDVSCRFLFVFPRFLRALRPLEQHLDRVPLGAQYAVFAWLT